MQKTILTLLAAAALTLAGCTVIRADAPTLFDLGPPPAETQQTPLAGQTISVAEVRVPAWLDTQLMYYRLEYAQRQQSRPYAASRWSMTPGELLAQRVRQRIAQAGAIVLSASDGTRRMPTLRIQLDDFSQHFPAPGTSTGRVSLRATAFRGREVIGQRSFEQEAGAPSADAAGGAQALAQASDAALSELIAWLASLPLQPVAPG
jgi:cholesterol transport system auxiliary component